MAFLFTLATLAAGTLLIVSLPGVALLRTFVPGMVVVMFGLGMVLDAGRKNTTAAATLVSEGFEDAASACDPAVVSLANSMAPAPLTPEYADFVLVGACGGRTVYLANYWNGEARYAFAAVQTARHWPKAVIRRKRIAGNLRDGHDLGDRAFDRQREILSEAPAEAMKPFEHLAGWFVTDDSVRERFRVHEIPGKNEQWAFGGHWVALADRGHAGPEQLLQLAEFLVAFAEAADAMDEPVAPDAASDDTE